jgi:hypothetical protein
MRSLNFFLGNTIAEGMKFPVALITQQVVTNISRSPLVAELTCFIPFLAIITVVVAVSSRLKMRVPSANSRVRFKISSKSIERCCP